MRRRWRSERRTPLTTHSEDLVSLEELRSVLSTYAGPGNPRELPARQRRRRWRPILVAVVAVLAFAGTSAAIADGLGAFDGGVYNGISSVHHPRTSEDVIDPATQAYMERKGCTQPDGSPCNPIVFGMLLDTSRRIAQLPSGESLYVFQTSWKGICFVSGPPPAGHEFECSGPLSHAHPSTVWVYTEDSDDPSDWLAFGIAVDGVTSVSFEQNGHEVTAPVKGNVWTYRGDSVWATMGLQGLPAHRSLRRRNDRRRQLSRLDQSSDPRTPRRAGIDSAQAG
jgi:hypothetical protein